MYKDSAQQIEELVEEAFGLIGMMQEVQMKCQLLKNKVRQEAEDQNKCWETDSASEELSWEVATKLPKMHDDLDRYSYRLDEIYEELNEINGNVS